MKSDDSDTPLSLDDQIKTAQLHKLQAELKQLKGITPDTWGKLLITLFGILAAGYALYIGVPQTRLELSRLQDDLLKKQQEFKLKEAELAGTELRRANTANELARLQNESRALGEDLERIKSTSGNVFSNDVEQRIEQVIKPRVFVQFAGVLNRENIINPLREALAATGLIVPAAERINKGQKNEVRYFSKNQLTLAQKVNDETIAYFKRQGCPLPSLSVVYVPLPDGKESPVELWLKHNCPAK